jgi:hypothetical protein
MNTTMDSQVIDLISNMNQRHVPMFLLVQGKKVHGVSKWPMNLPFGGLNHKMPWEVAIGTVNEHGEHEVVGKIAEAFPGLGACWRISSPIDGTDRLVGAVGTIAGQIHQRLRTVYGTGGYDDLCNLPPIITIYTCDSRPPK